MFVYGFSAACDKYKILYMTAKYNKTYKLYINIYLCDGQKNKVKKLR